MLIYFKHIPLLSSHAGIYFARIGFVKDSDNIISPWSVPVIPNKKHKYIFNNITNLPQLLSWSFEWLTLHGILRSNTLLFLNSPGKTVINCLVE